MKGILIHSTLALCFFATLTGCASGTHLRPSNTSTLQSIPQNHLMIQGQVSAPLMRFPATITVKDQQGHRVVVKTDSQGYYRLSTSALVPPLILSATERNGQCTREDRPMGICLAAVYVPSKESQSGQVRVNLNPLTDLMTSEIAQTAGYSGPEQFIEAKTSIAVTSENYQQSLKHFHQIFDNALAKLQLPADFNPITYSHKWYRDVQSLFSLLWVNRGYKSKKGIPSGTTLTDHFFRPIAVNDRDGHVMSVDLDSIYRKQRLVNQAQYRIFIVGDSTASIYPDYKYPRMGWGQVFQQQFNPEKVQVIDGAKSGRSSRLYRNEGWFRYLSSMMRPGDYLFIEMGHNDEKCDAAKSGRGAVDVGNLCTYPNDAKGKMQYPQGQPQMSFAKSLEFYIHYARSHGLIPVLLTPTTRFKNAHGKTLTPIVYGHKTKNKNGTSFAYVGDYSQTIKDTARVNDVVMLDIETRTIQFANRVGNVH
ncbi:MAG: hypothetical protein CENE_00800 [Candidatus Celerinatantimonas neptuna]|nr:MAG: hypothetical protein CENE_00800 [Candidatus Celerinatantimonas neptuna]